MAWISVAPCLDGFIHFSEGQEWSHPMCGLHVKRSSSYVILKLAMLDVLDKDYMTCRVCFEQARAMFS